LWRLQLIFLLYWL
jgi:hypothetical protein